MNLETFTWLLSEAGQELLAEAMRSDIAESARLRELTRLRKLATPERAAAAYELALLRRRAAAKFSGAAAMYFTREALEQASGEIITAHRANRYRGYGLVADLACGIGGDTLGLARAARVVAVERDPLRLAMAAANAQACGVAERITFVQADLEHAALPHTEAIFFDPARRNEGRRVFALDEYSPPVSIVNEWRRQIPAIGVKVAPGVSDDELAQFDNLEVEFISLDGELKEAVLWFGPFATVERRATLLSGGNDAERSAPASTLVSQPAGVRPPIAAPSGFLYEPDPAIIRAHLIEQLAEQLGAAQLDPTIAYLSSDRLITTPFARCWRILEWLPFNLKRLRARLNTLDVGPVTVKKRGSPLNTDALARQLSGSGHRSIVVVLTIVMGKPAALICEGPLTGDER